MEFMYSTELLEHFEHPRYAGELPTANARVRVENPACGDVLELAADVQNGAVVAVRFRAKGCVPAMACGSAIASLIHGKAVAQLLAIGKEDVLREVKSVPPASGHAVHLALDALAQLWNAIQKNATSTTKSRSAL
jgi:nitrogen fixation NifU-like protein